VQRPDVTLIFFDNASSDGTADVLEDEIARRKMAIRLERHSENVGFAEANNLALCAMGWESYDVVILLNPDTKVEEGWLEPLVAGLEDETVGSIVPLLVLPDGCLNARGNGLHYWGMGHTLGLGEKAEGLTGDEIFFGSGAALAISVQALKQIQIAGEGPVFWKKLFMYGEDTDLGWRFQLLGLKNRLEPRSRVIHYYRFDSCDEGAMKKMFWMERNRWLVLLANYHAGTLGLLLPWMILGALVQTWVWPALAGVERSRLYGEVIRLFLSDEFRRHRRAVQKKRKVKDRVLLARMGFALRHAHLPAGSVASVGSFFLRALHAIISRVIWW
jgi:GT2 family glycosyltransferase